MIAQDVFAIFISRVADTIEPLNDIEPRIRQAQTTTADTLGNPTSQPYLGLTSPQIENIVNKFIAAGLGSREDALMSIIPPLLQRSKLPPLDEVTENLLSTAKTLKRDNRFQQCEDLLQGLLYRGPQQFQGKVVRALGDLYRKAARSQKQSEQDFARNGFRSMCGIRDLSEEAQATQQDYEFVRAYFEKK
ncbi:hypothetical protein AOQ84DRAFT_226488 [Glonium stellatum]|uniref:Uncharacterized protein n=1 Tax=Glonium stellatum TaxID=574774 RepID=A0A8E2JNU4_9PEZI|nr:hypothetical protein AOQ84DRAFT_226488 [Glonium stellatum]